MADASQTSQPASAATPKKGAAKSSKPRKPKTAPNHPKVADMVNSAISNLKERGGSSLQAIKKYIAGNYKVDVEKLAPFIRRYLKAGVGNGSLVQTKGKGASGSFKLSTAAPKPKKEKAAKKGRKPKEAGEKKQTKKAAAKPKKAGEKKAAKPKKTAEKKTAKVKKPRAPKKEKKAKSPKKTKSPKPKKAAAKKATKK